LQLFRYQPVIPQSPELGGQVGTGMALVLAAMVVLVEDALAKLVAIAPVTARAITRVRTISFMMVTPFLVTLSGRNLIILWTLELEPP